MHTVRRRMHLRNVSQITICQFRENKLIDLPRPVRKGEKREIDARERKYVYIREDRIN